MLINMVFQKLLLVIKPIASMSIAGNAVTMALGILLEIGPEGLIIILISILKKKSNLLITCAVVILMMVWLFFG